MRKAMFVMFVVATALVVSSACDKRSPTSPSDPTPVPDDCGPFETRVYLTTPDGAPTPMWAQLNWVSPSCGSRVKTYPSASFPDDAFRYSAEAGSDMFDGSIFGDPKNTENINRGGINVTLSIWFSLDGERPIDESKPEWYNLNGTRPLRPGQSQLLGGDIMRLFLDPVPEFIIVTGRMGPRGWGSGWGTRPADIIAGPVRFKVNYRK